MKNKIIKINDSVPDVVLMPAEDFKMPELKIVVADDKEHVKYCRHDQVKIWKYHRTVQCANCGASVDPFEWLLNIANFQAGQVSQLKWLHNEVKWKTEEIESLDRKIRERKKQIKSL